MPYIKYKNANYKEYILSRDPKLTRYSRYICLNKTYNIRVINQMPSAQNQENLDSQIKKLDAEEEEAILKILRLKKQKRFLYKYW